MSTAVVDSGRVVCLVPSAPRCEARGDALRDYASRLEVTGQGTTDPDIIARRMIWDAPAASEYPRPILADCVDASRIRPDLASAIWHAAAGAIITPAGCDCATPAGHRDVFAAIGRTIGATTE
jgi:hypothetical protein